MARIAFAVILAATLAGTATVIAQDPAPISPVPPLPPPFNEWLSAVRAEAVERGIRPEILDRALEGVEPVEQILDRDRSQAEFTLNLESYLKRRLTPSIVKAAQREYAQHRSLLTKIDEKYGVNPRVVIAVWGLESNFGRFAGVRPTIPTLATLAYDQRRGRRVPVLRAGELPHGRGDTRRRGRLPGAPLNGATMGTAGAAEGGEMSQQSVIEELQRLGMSGYEAKAYVALVAAGTPLNGYEVAKRSGVPRSTVYETLGKLVGRGAAYEVRAGEASVGYISLPPNALLDRMRREFDHSIDTLRSALPQVASPPQVRLVHSLADRASLLARAEDVIAAAGSDLFLSGWPQEIAPLKPLVRRAADEGVDVSVVSFGEDPEPVGSTIVHRYSKPEVVLENLGCRLLVVSADREQAVIGGVVNGDAWGVFTDDPAVVLVAVEFVRHDIAMHLIADKFDLADFEQFWTSDPALLRLRADHGAPAALLRRSAGGASTARRPRRRPPAG